MIFTCLFGKPEAVEAIALGERGVDARMSEACVRWAPLPEPLPIGLDEEIVRVSRHALGSESWTWIGLYRHASAIGSTRPGGFYGAALLCRDSRIDGAVALRYLRTAANQLHGFAMEGDAFVRKLANLDPTFDHEGVRRELAPEPLAGRGGLRPDSDAEAMVAIPADRAGLATLIDAAQTGAAAQAYCMLYIGSPRLAAIARAASRTTRISVRDAGEFTPAPPPPLPPPPSGPFPATMAELDRLIERKIAKALAATAAGAEAIPSRPRRRSGWATALFLFQLLLVAAIAVTAWKAFGLG